MGKITFDKCSQEKKNENATKYDSEIGWGIANLWYQQAKTLSSVQKKKIAKA